MKAKITTEIDYDLKYAFEATKEYHKTSYREILEKGIMEVLEKTVSVEAIEARIKYREMQNMEDRDLAARMKVMQLGRKKIESFRQDEDERTDDNEMERKREKWFISNNGRWNSIVTLYKKKPQDINVKPLVREGLAKNEKDAWQWLKNRIEREIEKQESS